MRSPSEAEAQDGTKTDLDSNISAKEECKTNDG